MKFIDSLVVAVKSLFANKLRSGLTMLGVIIGVGSVITLMSVGRGAEASITSVFEQIGTNLLYVQPRNPDSPGMAGLSPAFTTPTLTMADAEAIADIPSVTGIAPTNENFIEISYRGESISTIIHGSNPEYLSIYNFTLASGQFITELNLAKRDSVVVLGDSVVQDLFGSSDPVGEKVKIKGRQFTVIGAMVPKGGAFLGISMDQVVVTPITTYQTRLYTERTASGEDSVQSIAIKVDSAENMDIVREDIAALLVKRHRITDEDKKDFAVYSQEQVLGILQQITGLLTLFLGAIASISLVVGGIGIMNIMFVSVTERTREIGIRKAVGGKRRDILLQFLFEAAILSLTGGSIGITGGWLVSVLISKVNAGGITLNAVVSPDIVILAVSVSVFIGLASGLYPAMRAARLNPIDALHYR